MRFANPYFIPLLLLPALLILFYIRAYFRTAHDLKIFASEKSLAKIIDPACSKLRYQRWILRLVGLIFVILALSGPQWGYQWKQTKTQGLEILFALDASKSMLASDIQPSRFERAKLAIKDFLNKIPGNRVGLIAFAGTSFLQCPLTMDYSAFNITLDALTIQSIPRGGTAIGTALTTAHQAFKSATGSKILILITDGENHEGDPVQDSRNAAKEAISIYTIGIGSPEGVFIEIKDPNGNSTFLKDSTGKPVKTSLNEQVLKDIASAGKGAYIKADGISLGLEELYHTKLLKYYQTELTAKKQKQYIDRYQIPLVLALICLLGEIYLGFNLPGFLKMMILRFAKQSDSSQTKEVH
jgi:Ca-activated chloride channel family protein